MSARHNPIFRGEALRHHGDRLHGDISIAVPLSWQLVGYLLLAALVAAILFLFTASYSRVETVAGTIVLDRGVAPIVPTRAGTVTALAVRNGQRVNAGDSLVRIRSEEDSDRGGTTPQRILAAMGEQDARLASQSGLVLGAAAAERARLMEQIGGLQHEIASLDSQIVQQRRLVEIADGEFQTLRSVANNGFISRRDLAVREGNLLTRRQQLEQLDQARSAKRADLAEARRMIAQAAATAEAQAAALQSNRAELAQRLAQVESTQGYSLNAPVDGIVTALTARVGQPIAPGQPVMVLVPSGARRQVQLNVPTQAVGFLAIGQEVRVAVDAFPYQQFGTIKGRIVEISSVAIPGTAADGGTTSTYLVAVEVEQPWIMAFGRRQPLLPGMTLSARIVTERQSLMAWLFQPLFAVARR